MITVYTNAAPNHLRYLMNQKGHVLLWFKPNSLKANLKKKNHFINLGLKIQSTFRMQFY